MPFLDVQAMFSDAQVVAGPGTVVSTNTIDPLAAKNLGAGENIELLCQFSNVLGAATQLQAILYCADDAAMTINKTVVADSGQSAVVAAGSSGLLRLGIKAMKPRRFWRVEYVLVGAASGATITCGFTINEQTTPETLLA